jgi:2-polyprenyl-6-methoxyphenol hydroxylase-like FAD-dependent oxidoreductase
MVEDIFIQDMKERGVEVTRSSPFVRYETTTDQKITAFCRDAQTGSTRSIRTKYLVGCDGAHSNVRKSIPGAEMRGESSNSKWGVLDGKSPAKGESFVYSRRAGRRD